MSQHKLKPSWQLLTVATKQREIYINLPWVNANCIQLMNTGDHHLQTALKSGMTIDAQKSTSARNIVTQALCKAKTKAFRTIKGKREW